MTHEKRIGVEQLINAAPDKSDISGVSAAMTTNLTQTSPAAPVESEAAAPLAVVRVEARPGWIGVNWQELWKYRDLLGFLASRDIKVRYKQTVLGIAWAVVQPVVETLVFFVGVYQLAGVKASGNARIDLLNTFAGMLIWKLFESALTQSSNSLVASQQLLTKVYFPRLIIPISAVFTGIVDLAVASLLLIPMMWFCGVAPQWGILTLPIWVGLALFAALAVGLWLSALNVQYRDIRYLVPFMIRIWLLITPVIYTADKVPAKWLFVYGLNPVAGAVSGFRWAITGAAMPWQILLASTISTAALLLGGLFYFRRMEKTFADVV